MKNILYIIIFVLVSSGVMGQTISKKDSILNYLHNYDYSKIDSVIIKRKFSVDEFLTFANKNYTTDRDKARACYSFVIEYLTYSQSRIGFAKNQEYISGYQDAIKYKQGVCYHYSCLYKYMCNKLGLECEMISGLFKCQDWTYNKGVLSPHGWNIVTIDNAKYLVDITMDNNGDKVSSYISKFWYIIKPEIFIETHYPANLDITHNSKESMRTIIYVTIKNETFPTSEIFVNNAYNFYLKNKEMCDYYSIEKSKFQCLEKPITFEYFICKKVSYINLYDKYIPVKTLPANYPNLYLSKI